MKVQFPASGSSIAIAMCLVLVGSMALSGIGGAVVSSTDDEAKSPEILNPNLNSSEVSIKQATGSMDDTGGHTKHPAIKANRTLTFQNGENYHFLVTNEDSGESITLAINETVEIPAGQKIDFRIYNGDGTPQINPLIASRGFLSADVISGSVSAASGPTNFSVALLDASTGDELARTETLPSVVAYKGTLKQNSTSGQIRVSLPRNVLDRDTSVELTIFRGENRFQSDGTHTFEMEYNSTSDEFATVIDASSIRPANYSYFISFKMNDFEVLQIKSRFTSNQNITKDGTEVGLSPVAPKTGVSGQAAIDVIVNYATAGIGAWDVTVSVANTSVATITDASAHPDAGTVDNTIAEDGSSVQSTSFGSSIKGGPDVAILTVTLDAHEIATVDLSVSVNDLTDTDANEYTVPTTSGATLSVVAGPGDVTGDGNAANDPDGDGKFEDIDGDGSFSIIDVQTFFVNRDSDAIKNNAAFFDFSGDGSVGIVDIQQLFIELTG